MSHPNTRRLALSAVVIAAAMSACGGSTGTPATATPTPVAITAGTPTTPPSTGAGATVPASAPVPTLIATAAAPSCPAAAMAGAALGISLPAPVGIQGGGGTPLPAGATAVVCEYHATAYNVLITLITNISPSSITSFTKRFPVAPTTVSGVGDQAQAFVQSLGGGKDNEGVVATKGSKLVSIVATDTPASLAQIEALVNQLL